MIRDSILGIKWQTLAFEQEAHAGDSSFGFLQLGDVDGADSYSGGAEDLARLNEVRRHQQHIPYQQHVCGRWLGGGNVNDPEIAKFPGIDPLAIGEDDVAAGP